MSKAEAAMRRTGALVALASVSALVFVLVPAVPGSKHGVLALYLYAIFLLSCAAVLLSPAHRAAAELARQAVAAAREIFGAPGRAPTELWSALAQLLETTSSCSASSPAGARGTNEAAVRRTGALVVLAAASALVFVPAVEDSKHALLALYAVLLIGCGAVLLSPAHRAADELVRRAAEAAREFFFASARATTELRWAGFTFIMFYAIYVTGDVLVPATAAAQVSVEKVNGLFLFLVFLVGVWTVSLSMLTGRGPPPLPLRLPLPPPLAEAAAAEEEYDGGEVNGMVSPAACDDVVPKV